MEVADVFEALFHPKAATDPMIRVAEQHLVLQGLAFCDSAVAAGAWEMAEFGKLVGGYPFRVESGADCLALGIGYGREFEEQTFVSSFEWLHVFGAVTATPDLTVRARDSAFHAYCASCLEREQTSDGGVARFSALLNEVREGVDKSVLVLGSYRTDAARLRIRELATQLTELGYEPFTLAEAKDVSIQQNREKLIAGTMLSRFVVALDDEPSGHLAELAQLVAFQIRPVLVVRHGGASTNYLDDSMARSPMFRVVDLGQNERLNLAQGIRWAADLFDESVKSIDSINFWRREL